MSNSEDHLALINAIEEEALVRLLVTRGATFPPHTISTNAQPDIIEYIEGVKNWTPLHRAADARDADALIECLSNRECHDVAVVSSHPDMCTALSIASSDSYPTAQPVCERCLTLLKPDLVKGEAPSGGSLFGGGGGGGAS